MSLLAELGERIAQRSPDASGAVIKERRALLQRILWSRQIERYGRIREFLEYVCERGLEDPTVQIHEQEIGHKVFGRDRDYDTSADNIVRVTASQARKKLEQYFASEGKSEPVILEIPKGQYTPLIRPRVAASDLPAIEPPIEDLAPLAIWYRHAAIACALVALGLGVLSLVLGQKLRARQASEIGQANLQPALVSLWSQLLPVSGRTDIVVADSSLSLFEELLDHQLTLAEYLKLDQWSTDPSLPPDPRLRAFAELAAQRGFTSMASVTAVSRITQLAGGKGQNLISILRARDFNMTQMKFDNVILLGSSRANPWQDLLEDRLNFRFGYDQKARYSYFQNRNPAPGEEKFYRMAPNVSYCRIAFLPNFAGTGNILSIAGTEIEGTGGGGEFVTSERSVAKLIALFGVALGKPMPHFEALLRSSRIAGQTEGLSIVAFRVSKP